MNYRGVVR